MAFPADWSHYWQATPINPVETLSGFLAYVELSGLSGLGAIANSSGADIRASISGNTQIPCDVMPWYNNGTGILYLNLNKNATGDTVRIWAGNPSAIFDDVSDTYGRYATYDSSIQAFYASGSNEDRTANERHLNIGLTGSPTYGIGRNANHRSAYHDGVTNILTRTITLNTFGDTYMAVAATYRSGVAQVLFTSQEQSSHRTDLRFGSNNRIQCLVDGAGGGAVTVNTSSGITGNGQYVHAAIQSLSATGRSAFINGGGAGFSATLQTPNSPQSISVGGYSDNGVGPNGYFSGVIQYIHLNTNVLSTGYINYESQLQDNAGFWGPWTQYNLTFPNSWSGYDTVVPILPTGELTDFAYLVNLGQMSPSWWSAVKSDGGDIRASKEDNTQLAVDVIEFDYTGQVGIIAVGFSGVKSTGISESLRIYAGQPYASLPAPTDTYGSYRAYPNHLVAFYPHGAGLDRTISGNNLSVMVGSLIEKDSNGSISGSKSTSYSGQFCDAQGSGIPSTQPFTLMGLGQIPSTTANRDFLVLANTGSANSYAQVFFNGIAVGDPISSRAQNGGGNTTQNSNTPGFTANTWTHITARFFHASGRDVASNASFGPLSTVSRSVSGPQTIRVGGSAAGTGGASLIGKAGFVEIHRTGLSDGWVSYHYNMTRNTDPTQTGFYTFQGWTENVGDTGGGTGVTNIAIQGIVNVYTSTDDNINKNIYSYGESNTYSSTIDSVSKNIYPYAESNTRTDILGNNFKNIYGNVQSNTYTSSVVSPYQSIFVYGESNTNTSIYGLLTVESTGDDTPIPTGEFPSGWLGYEEIYIPRLPSYITTTGQVFRIATTGFSSAWKNAVGVSGQDIRVTTANGTRLPVDVVYMNNGNAHIEFNLTGDYPRDPRDRIRFWVGNTGADFEPATGTYGQYNVYPFNLFGYYPSGGGIDRTRYQNHLTGINTVTGETHLSVFPSTFYSGAYNSCLMPGITGVPLTMTAYVKTYAMTGNQVIMGLFNNQSTGDAYMMHLRGNNDTSAISVRSNTGNNTLGGDSYVSGEWGQFAGNFSANNRRDIYKDGQQQASSSVAITGNGINTFGLGAYLGLTQSGSAVAHLSFVQLYSGDKSEAALLYDYQNPINNSVSHGWFPAFNPVGWSGYDEITINEQASGIMYDQTYLLSTCLLSPTLLSVSKPDGGDLRIVKTDNVTELPIDVIHFNNTPTGMLGFMWPGQKIPGQVDKFRVWAGNSSASRYSATGQFGQYNVYSTGMLAFYPSGGGMDRTSGQLHMIGVNVSSGNTTGPLSGLYATSFDGNPANMGCNIPQLIRRPINVFSVFETNVTNTVQVVAAVGAISNSRYTNAIRLNATTGVTHHMNVNAGIVEAIALSGYTSNVWYSADAYQDDGINKYINLNGEFRNSGSLPIQFGSSKLSIGGYSGTTSPSTGDYFNGTISLTTFDLNTRYGYEPIYNYHMVFDHANFYSNNGWVVYGSESSGETGITNISFYGVINVYTNSFAYPFVNRAISSVSDIHTSLSDYISASKNIGGISNIYTQSINVPSIAKNLDSTSQTRTSTHNSNYPFLAKNLAAISATNTAIYGLATSDGLIIVSVGGTVNVFTSSSANPSRVIGIAGSSDTVTSANGLPLKGVEIAIESLTRTSTFGQVLKGVGLSGDSNTQTSSIATPIVDIVLGTTSISGESGTKTAAIAAVTVLISASAIAEVRTMLEGYAISVGERTCEDNYELTVYINVENSEILHLCRNNEMTLFITQNQSKNLII